MRKLFKIKFAKNTGEQLVYSPTTTKLTEARKIIRKGEKEKPKYKGRIYKWSYTPEAYSPYNWKELKKGKK